MGTPFNHPKYGTSLRGVNRMLTDLPLPATKPIDFGGYEFCKNCGICADNCPFGAIQTGEPTWEHPSPWNGQGYLGWPADTSKCPHCPSCQGSCPFNSLEQGSAIHDLVRATVSTTSLFNGFFVIMENSFGYADKRDPRDWFDLERPTWGIDTRW